MILRIGLVYLCILFFKPVKAQDTIRYDFEAKYKQYYNMMPLSNVDSIVKYIKEYEDSALNYDNKLAYAHAQSLRGTLFLVMYSDYITAYRYFIDCLKLYEKENHEDGITRIKLQFGVINYTLKNFEQAIEDLNEACKLSILNKNFRRAGICKYLTALTYLDLKQPDKAQTYIDSAETLYKKAKYDIGFNQCLLVNGIIKLEKKDFNKAIELLEEYKNIYDNKPYDLGFSNPFLAKAYFENGNIKKARELAEWSLTNSREIKKPLQEIVALEILKEILYVEKEYQLSAEMGRDYNVLKDSIYNANRLYKTAVMKFAYDSERKDFEEAVKIAQKEEIQKATLDRQKLLTNFFLITSIIVLLLVMGIFHQYKQKEKTNKELAIAMINLKKTQDQLVLKEKLASLGQLTAGIAHEIQNPLNFVNNFAQVSLEMAEEAEQVTNLVEAKEYIHDIKSNLSKVNFHGNRVSSIIRSMLQHSRFSTQEKIITDINKFVEDFVNIAITGKKAANLTLDFEVKYYLAENLPLLEVVQQDLGRVLINLFNNAFDAILDRSIAENGTYKPAISVTTGVSDSFIFIDITDNGKGIPEAIKQRIFEPFFTTKKAGAGTGLGLSITNEILIAHGGMLQVDSKPGAGSTFRIKLPVA